MKRIKKLYQTGGLLGDSSYMNSRNKTNQQVSAGIGVVGAINPLIGAALGIGQQVGAQTVNEYGLYKSRTGEFIDNNLNPTTGIQNLKDFSSDPTWSGALNQFSAGLFGTSASQGRARQAKEDHQRFLNDQQNQMFRQNSQAILDVYPSNGVKSSGYAMKYGGKIPSFLTNALAEGGEVIVSDTPPRTDENGGVSPLASDVSKFYGDSHEAQSGGVGFKADSQGFIFSDELRTPEGLTYAKSAEIIGRQKGKFEKKLKDATDEAAHNTATRMIEKLDHRLELLFNHQEMSKGPQSYNPINSKNDMLFQDWYKNNTLEGQNGIPYSDSQSYDYYSYFKDQGLGNSGNIEQHFPDTYKRPDHPTFSNESIYSTPENPGGQWKGEKYKKKGKFLRSR